MRNTTYPVPDETLTEKEMKTCILKTPTFPFLDKVQADFCKALNLSSLFFLIRKNF